MSSRSCIPHAERETRLRRTLEDLLNAPVHLTMTENKRAMVSWRRRGEAVFLRLHGMFLSAEGTVLSALAECIRGDGASARARLQAFFREHRATVKTSPEQPRRNPPGRPSARLEACYRRINETYFGGKVTCRIGWGRRRTRRGQRSVRLGSYSPRYGLILINPVLDHPMVPLYVVEGVIYHEMLHHHLGTTRCNGKRFSHHAAFREQEKRFAEQEQARVWIQKNLSRLLEITRGVD